VQANKVTLQEIKNKIKSFVKERDWEQYHSPKNLSMSIAIEAAELMEHFQWTTNDHARKLLRDKRKREEIEDELADIAIFILDFCNAFQIDIEQCILRKLEKSKIKYPASIVKGKAHKYTYYRTGKE
jgi:NTP pyrophosphatase (non-canonical NTP hydrolase)